MNKIFSLLLFGFGGFLLAVWLLSMRGDVEVKEASGILSNTWQGYKHYFIGKDGEVLRPPASSRPHRTNMRR